MNDFSNHSVAVESRYRDAYLVARTVNRVGQTVKKVGLIGGLSIIVFSLLVFLALASEAKGNDINGIIASLVLYIGTASAVVVGVLLYILGVLIASQGQILTATLDGSVNTSPFLANEQRAEIMSLGNSRTGTTDSKKTCEICGKELGWNSLGVTRCTAHVYTKKT